MPVTPTASTGAVEAYRPFLIIVPTSCIFQLAKLQSNCVTANEKGFPKEKGRERQWMWCDTTEEFVYSLFQKVHTIQPYNSFILNLLAKYFKENIIIDTPCIILDTYKQLKHVLDFRDTNSSISNVFLKKRN